MFFLSENFLSKTQNSGLEMPILRKVNDINKNFEHTHHLRQKFAAIYPKIKT